MRDYSKISPKLWRSQRFRNVGSDDARLLYVFLLSCEHQNSAGCPRLPDAYAAADLNWTAERLNAARLHLITADLISHDGATDEYFVHRWFRHNPTTNPKHIKGVERLISELDSDLVREVAETEYEAFREEKAASQSASEALTNGNRLANSSYLNGGKR